MPDRFLPPPSRQIRSTANDARVLRDRMQAHVRAMDRQTGQPKPFITARQFVQVYNGGSMGSAADLIYFTHPVLATGAETEGGAAVLTVDTATTVPVVVLGHAPALGDYLTAYAVGGRWVSERGGASGVGFTTCFPCAIPNENLTISWVNILAGNGSATMVYTTGPAAWKTGCADGGLLFSLSCNSGNIELRVVFFLSGSCPTGQSNYCSNFGVPPLALTLSGHTCSPFSLTFTVGENGCPTIYGAGNTTFTITL